MTSDHILTRFKISSRCDHLHRKLMVILLDAARADRGDLGRYDSRLINVSPMAASCRIIIIFAADGTKSETLRRYLLS